MKMAIQAMMFLGMFAVVVPAMADKQQPGEAQPQMGKRLEKRIERQEKRIDMKLKKKKISEDEANKLKADVQAVEAKKEEAMKDGKITKEERKEIRQGLNKTHQEIKAAGQSATTPAGQ